MNLVFHTLFSISTSPICAKKIAKNNKPFKYLTLGAIGNIIGHAIMDLVPHDYPLTTKIDVLISFVIFLLSILFVKKEYVYSILFCFLGGVLPDLIDKALLPIIGLRQLDIFPFHWANIINFFYKWYTFQMFEVFNILAMLVSLILLVINIKFITNNMLKYTKVEDKKVLSK